MYLEKTSNGVRYHWYLASVDGAGFIFFKDNHSDKEVKKAIREIKNTRDCVTYKIANIHDYTDIYWGEVFKIAEKEYGLTWRQIDCDFDKLMKAYKKGVTAQEYVKKNLKKWRTTIKVSK